MKINRNVFIHGFELGYFFSNYDFWKPTSNRELTNYAIEGIIAVVNSFSENKMDENIDYGDELFENATRRYVDAFYKYDNIPDYICLGRVFSALRLEKKFKDIAPIAANLRESRTIALKGVSWKLIFKKRKFLEFLDYLHETSSRLNVYDIDVIASAVHLYLTNSFNKNEDVYFYLLNYVEDDEDIDGEEQYEENDNPSVFTKSKLSDKYVFISYSSKNQKMADIMQKNLNECNIRTWIATKDIPAGLDYPTVISDAIENSSCVLLILSEEAQKSRYVMSEIRLAYDSNIPIICMNIDNCQLISGFKLLLGTQQIVSINSSDDMHKVFIAVASYIDQ